jgi:hypothetical protein
MGGSGCYHSPFCADIWTGMAKEIQSAEIEEAETLISRVT